MFSTSLWDCSFLFILATFGLVKQLLFISLLFLPAIGGSYNCPVDAAISDLHITEKGGNNQGFTDWDFELDMREAGWKRGQAWCAYSVIKWMNECSVPHTITGWSPTSYNKKDVVFTDSEFKQKFHKDDVMTMSLSYDKFKNNHTRFKAIGHVGIVKRLYKSSVVSIEGNTNDAGDRDSRAGDGVYQKRRPLTRNTHITRWQKYNQSIPLSP
jgi:hypothetical protein